MRQASKYLITVFVLSFLPAFCFAQGTGNHLHLVAQIISIAHFILLICSVICIKQFFWPSDTVRLPFQLFNLIFIILFYSLSLTFLINNREFYQGYDKLTPAGAMQKFFLSPNIDAFTQWIILFAGIINILYIIRYRADYINMGIPSDYEDRRPLIDTTEEESVL